MPSPDAMTTPWDIEQTHWRSSQGVMPAERQEMAATIPKVDLWIPACSKWSRTASSYELSP